MRCPGRSLAVGELEGADGEHPLRASASSAVLCSPLQSSQHGSSSGLAKASAVMGPENLPRAGLGAFRQLIMCSMVSSSFVPLETRLSRDRRARP